MRTTRAITLVAAALLTLIALTALAAPPSGFTLDGKPIDPKLDSLQGTPWSPAAGDVIHVDDYVLTMPGPGPYHFRSKDEAGLLELVEPSGSTRVVAARAWYSDTRRKPKGYHPLGRLDAVTIKGLWGVRFDLWSDKTAQDIAAVDLEHTCVAITIGRWQRGRATMPDLPGGMRCLRLELNAPKDVTGLEKLASLKKLRWLELTEFEWSSKLDAESLRGLSDLRVLRISGLRVSKALALGSLDALRRLELSGIATLDDLGFASGLTGLRQLRLHEVPAKDFRPLAAMKELACLDLAGLTQLDDIGFAAPMTQLREVVIDGSEVLSLEPLSEKAELRYVSAKDVPLVTAARGPLPKLSRIEGIAPALASRMHGSGANAAPDKAAQLAAAVKGADRIHVIPNGLCADGRQVTRSRISMVYEEKRQDEIDKLIAAIALDEGKGEAADDCGHPIVEFKKGNAVLAAVGVQKGTGLRWVGKWDDVVPMSRPFAEYLYRWLSDLGYSKADNPAGR